MDLIAATASPDNDTTKVTEDKRQTSAVAPLSTVAASPVIKSQAKSPADTPKSLGDSAKKKVSYAKETLVDNENISSRAVSINSPSSNNLAAPKVNTLTPLQIQVADSRSESKPSPINISREISTASKNLPDMTRFPLSPSNITGSRALFLKR